MISRHQNPRTILNRIQIEMRHLIWMMRMLAIRWSFQRPNATNPIARNTHRALSQKLQTIGIDIDLQFTIIRSGKLPLANVGIANKISQLIIEPETMNDHRTSLRSLHTSIIE